MEVTTPGTDPIYTAEPYCHLRFSDISTLQLGVTSFLLLCAFINVNRETPLSSISSHKRTIWSLDNYKVNADGVKYYNYTDPATGQKIDAAPGRVWYDEVLRGKHVYLFGNDFDTFCWARLIPAKEWFRSIYRASQLTPWVQVPLKGAVLFGMTFRIINAILFGYMKNFKDPPSSFGKYFMWIVVYNEIFHNITLFMLSNYLRDPDKAYFYLFRPAFITAYITFVLKMLFSFWHTRHQQLTYIRIVLAVVVGATFIPNYTNILVYLDHNYCDSYTTPLLGLLEWAAIICLWCSDVLDTMQCGKLDVIAVKTYYEEEEEIKVNGTPM